MNPDTNKILASELASNEMGDSSLVRPLLEQIQSLMTSGMADEAYDGQLIYRAVAARQPQLPPAVIISPRVTTVPSSVRDTGPKPRGRQIQIIQEKGRRGWQKAVG